MKKYCFSFFFFIGYLLLAQEKFNPILKVKLLNNELKENVNVLVKANPEIIHDNKIRLGYRVNYTYGDISSITIDPTKLAFLSSNKNVEYVEYIEPIGQYELLNDTLRKANGILHNLSEVYAYDKELNGEGTIVGIIDTGIDISHSDFKDENSKTRIKYLWDQCFLIGNNSPSRFDYGSEWNGDDIDEGNCQHVDEKYNGHGTYVAGIAAGGGRINSNYKGIASKADLIVVALDLNGHGPKLADAVKYIIDKANMLGKPCVINLSIGTEKGSHDATDLQSKLIEKMIANAPGRAFVTAAGNSGEIKSHLGFKISHSDTTCLSYNPKSKNTSFSFFSDIKYLENFKYSLSFWDGEKKCVWSSAFYNLTELLNGVCFDSVFHRKTKIAKFVVSAAVNPYGVFELLTKTSIYVPTTTMRLSFIGNNAELCTWNQGFYGVNSEVLKYDSLITIESGIQCSDEVITVGNYLLKDIPSVGSRDDVATTSSLGPTRDLRMKPDLIATGTGIVSCYPFGLNGLKLPGVSADRHYIEGGGTSASSPVVAGLIALIYQIDPYLTGEQIKNIIRDNSINSFDNNFKTGFGKLQGNWVLNSVQKEIERNQRLFINRELEVYKIGTDIVINSKSETPINLYIYDIYGNEIEKIKFSAKVKLKALNFKPGLYLFNIGSSFLIRF